MTMKVSPKSAMCSTLRVPIPKKHVSHSLNSLKRIMWGTTVIKGDTRSLDYSSCKVGPRGFLHRCFEVGFYTI